MWEGGGENWGGWRGEGGWKRERKDGRGRGRTEGWKTVKKKGGRMKWKRGRDRNLGGRNGEEKGKESGSKQWEEKEGEIWREEWEGDT